jgi:thioesterase domain-containing protein
MILADNTIAAAAYVPKFYPGQLSLFRATEAIFYSQDYLTSGLGWRDQVRDLAIYDVPGCHMTMVEEPHAQALAMQMGRAMATSLHRIPQTALAESI